MQSDLPFVTIVVAMRNEEKYIQECLESLHDQGYPKDKIEVLVGDGLSTDNSVNIASKIVEKNKNWRIFKNDQKIQSCAWNTGIAMAKGELIGIASAHAIFASDYISQAVETHLRTKADLVGGPVQSISHTTMGEAIALAITTPFGVGGAQFRYLTEEQETDTVFMGVGNRKLFERIGGFDEELVRNQDDELSYRLRKNGGKIICNPKIQSHYFNRATIRSLAKQYFIYGMWKIRVLQKHPLQMRFRHFVPVVFISSLIISGILLPFLLGELRLFLLILCSYLFANIGASILVVRKKGWKYLSLLPIVFVTLHVSYGLGFLFGFFRFIHRWGDKEGKVPKYDFSNA